MAQKSALIVDDSRTAREALRRMLVEHDLRIETAESAEAALEFLATHRPDVVFMDHMMPGMDGFQAVKAIKENPATATIPVLMYTSQSGELYVGQARALGAVGVLPKQIRPVEVAEVLRSLHLLPGSEPPTPARRAGDQPGLPGVESVNSPADWSDLHRWLQEMLADHNRALRVDVETTVTRVLTEHRRAANSGFWPWGGLITALACVAAVFLWLHLDTQARYRTAMQQNLGLLAALDARRASDTAATADLASREASVRASDTDRSAGVTAALEWSMNQGATFPPDSVPFDDVRLTRLMGLMDRLRNLDFRGTVRLEGHLGDFCMQRRGDSDWALADPDLAANRCDRIGLGMEESRREAARQSVAFANYLAELEVAGGPIRVEVESLGNSEPVALYPPLSETLTAGEWNRVAAQNQRVAVRLLPDGRAAAARIAP